MPTRIKLVTDPETGTSAWYKRGSGDLFIQCAYEPVDRDHDTGDECPVDLPEDHSECGVTETAVEGVPPEPDWSDDQGGGGSSGDNGGGGDDSSSSSSSSSSDSSSSGSSSESYSSDPSVSSGSSSNSYPSSDSGSTSDSESSIVGSSSSGSIYIPPGSGDSSSVSSSSSASDQCPDVSWEFETSVETNPWTEHSEYHIEYRVQASSNCGGSNDTVQFGDAVATITVPVGKKVILTWQMIAVVEAQDAGFDFAEFYVDGALNSRIDSVGNDSGCSSTQESRNGVVEFLEGEHTFGGLYNTVDSLYHTDSFGVEFIFSCEMVDA